jgi:O-antigen ligase
VQDGGVIEGLAATRDELTATDQFVLVVAALSPIAWAPVFLFHSAPRVALALALLPIGMLSLIRLARRRDAASIAALALSGAALVSSFLSPAPLNSLMGTLDWWTGTLGLTTALAWWAAGRELGPRARALLIPALTVGALWNALIALAQVTLEINTGTLITFPGRGSGTMLNPVYYGAYMSGVLACWLMLSTRSRRSALVVLALAFGLGLSGGRIAVGIALVVGVVALVVRAERRVALRDLAVMMVGVYVATLVVASDSPGSAVTARVASGGSGDGGNVRLAIWRAALDAVARRPVLGWGSGNIEIATERQFDLAFTSEQLRSNGSLLRWTDTHNVVLNLMVGLGLVGFALVVAFVGLSLRRFFAVRDRSVNRAMLAGAFAMAANWMLQPSTIHTIPIALLLFGASLHLSSSSDELPHADGRRHDEPRVGAVSTVSRRVMVVGSVLGAVLLVNLFVIDRALRYERLDAVNVVARYGYRDPFVDELLASEFRLGILSGDRDLMLDRAAWFANRQAAHYPAHAAYELVGEIAYSRGDLDGAEAAERRALEVQPWNPLTHRRLLVLAEILGDDEMYDESMRALCAVGSDACDTDALAAAADPTTGP